MEKPMGGFIFHNAISYSVMFIILIADDTGQLHTR